MKEHPQEAAEWAGMSMPVTVENREGVHVFECLRAISEPLRRRLATPTAGPSISWGR